jgi:glucosamine--fructose-6-phosphate aminotransferase (isomerizing)
MVERNTRDLELIPELMNQTLEMVAPQIEAIAKDINEWNDMYCLGYGATYPIALEGALKLKEIMAPLAPPIAKGCSRPSSNTDRSPR